MKKLLLTTLLALSLLFTACANGTELPDDTEPNGDIYVDENKYIEGIYLSFNGSPMIIINGTAPCYMFAKSDEVSFEGLTDGDRIRIKNTMIRETYPGQVDVYTLEKTADGEYSDIDKSVIDSLESLSDLTVDEYASSFMRAINVISNEGELDIKSVHVPIESKDVRCYSAAFDERYQMYFLHGNEMTLHIIDMQEGVIAHTETLDTDNLPSQTNYGTDSVTVFDIEIENDITFADSAYEISKSGDSFTVTPKKTELYPVCGPYISSPDGKYTIFNIDEDGVGHGGIDVIEAGSDIPHVFRNVAFDAHVGGEVNDIQHVAHYEAVGFLNNTAFVYNIYGWEHHIGFGIYDFSIDETVYFKSGDFVAHDVYDEKVMVEERAPYYDVTQTNALWSVDADGNSTLLATQDESESVCRLDEYNYCYFSDGVWFNFKTNIDIGEAEVKRLEIRSADFKEVLAEIEYPYGDVMFYRDENLRANENSITVVFFDIK
ncbi:MAG: hypothetical protein IJY93_08035 [Clostridia bacterium]|nr:hypothetical protein [Clostridia bacterium]